MRDGKAQILIIEDSDATRMLLEVCLDRQEYEITSRATGPSGLEEALARDHDLLILDIALPGMGGWEVLEHIRADEHRRDIAVIVLTAHHDTVLSEDAPLVSSIEAFVPKPFEVSDLERLVTEVLADRLGDC